MEEGRERSLLPLVMLPEQQEANFKLLKWRLNSYLLKANNRWQHFTVKKEGQSSIVGCGKRKAGEQGSWQKVSLFKKELELVKRGSDFSSHGLFMRRACYAGRSGNGESYKKNSKTTARSVHVQV